jgi:hypothetical protein
MTKPNDKDKHVEYGVTAAEHVPNLEGGLGGGPIGSPGSMADVPVEGPLAGDAAPDLGVAGHESSATGRAEREEYVEDQVYLTPGGPTGPDGSMQTPGGISEGTLLDSAGILGTDPCAEEMPGSQCQNPPREERAA